MNAGAEGDVWVGPARDVHFVGSIELVGVAVGRGNEPAEAVVLLDELASHLHVLGRQALDGLNGRVVAQGFLVSADHHALRVGLQQIPLVAVLHESEGAVADQVDGGLVACQQQQRGVYQRLLAGEDTGLFALRQHRDEIVAGVDDTLFHHGVDVLEHIFHAFHQPGQAVDLAAGDVEQLLGDGSNVGTILDGHAHHLGDDQHRKRSGQVSHHVEVVFLLGFIQQLVDGVLDQRPPLFHGLGREVGMHDLAHFQVVWAVVLDELLSLVVANELVQLIVRLVDGGVRPARVVEPHGAGEELMVAGQPYQVIVPGNDPEFVQLVPVDRVFVPELSVIGVGIVHDFRGKHVFVEGRYHNLTNVA